MTIDISNNNPRASYAVAQGATQTSFTVNFEFFENADLNVYVDGTKKTLTAHYTVSGGSGSTGTVTMSVTGATGGSTVVITRDTTIERTTDFSAGADINRAALNTQLDTLTAMVADIEDQASRAIQVSDHETAPSLELPSLDSRKGTVMGFNASTGAVEAGPKIADVSTLAAVTADIATLADIEDGTDATDAIQTAASNSSNITTVAGISGNVTTVAGIASNVTSVAGNATNINTVAGDTADINALGAKTTQLGLLGTSDAIADMNTLGTSDIVSDMNTLGTSSNVTNMDTLAGISGNITTVAGVASNVTTVAGSISNVNTTASNISSVNTNATNISAIQGASGNASTATTKASEAATSATGAAASATSAATAQTAAEAARDSALAAFDSFDDRYLGSKSSAPSVDNDGNALASGALYYDTTANAMQVYTGSAWVAAYASLSGALLVTNNLSDVNNAANSATNLGLGAGNTPTFNGVNTTGDISFGDNDKAKFGASNDLEVYHNGSASVINDAGQGDLYLGGDNNVLITNAALNEIKAQFVSNGAAELYYDNSKKFETSSVGSKTDQIWGISDVDTGIALGANGSDIMQFYTGNNERMRLASGGYLGLGNASPAFVFDAYHATDNGLARFESGDADCYITLSDANSSGSGYNKIGVVTDDMYFNTNNSEKMRIRSNGDVRFGAGNGHSPLIQGTTNSGRTAASPGYSFNDDLNTGMFQPVSATDTIAFSTGGTERMRLTSSGSLGVGLNSPSTKLHVKGDTNQNVMIVDATGTSANYIFDVRDDGTSKFRVDGSGNVGINTTSTSNIKLNIASGSDATGSGNGIAFYGSSSNNQASIQSYNAGGYSGDLRFYTASRSSASTSVGGERMRLESDGDLHVDGNVIAYSTTISDERLKEDIKPIEGALDKVGQLSGYTFTYKADGKQSAGVIAQEVEAVLPSAVTESTLPLKTDDDVEYKTVQYDQLHGLLIEAIKELKAEIEELKNGSAK